MSDSNERPIDKIRNSARSGQIGTGDDTSAIREMIPIGRTLYFVKERGVYAMQLADAIDPERTNPSIPDTQRRVLPIGSDDPLVARTLLTAKTLFNGAVLPNGFPVEKARQLALDALIDLRALSQLRAEFEAAEAAARASLEASNGARAGPFVLPETSNLKGRCDAFAQKAGHIVNTLEQIAKVFYPAELSKKWIDALLQLWVDRLGADSPVTKWMHETRPFLLFVTDMRNMIEHPKPDWRININDFKLLPSGEIEPPSVEILRPDEEGEKATITPLLHQMADRLLHATEGLIACLCAANVRPFAGMSVGVVELPLEEREFKEQRFYYGVQMGGRVVRFG